MIKRPETLGAELKFETLEDVDAALHELGWCRQQKAEVDARTQAAVDRMTADSQAKLVVEIAGQPVSIADRAKALEAAVVTWCGAKLAGHLAETGSQSLKLAHGVVGTRSLPDVVECDDKKVIAAITKKTGLTGLIATLLEKVCGAIRLADVIKLKPEVSKTAAKAAWSTGTRAQKTLQALGVEVKAIGRAGSSSPQRSRQRPPRPDGASGRHLPTRPHPSRPAVGTSWPVVLAAPTGTVESPHTLFCAPSGGSMSSRDCGRKCHNQSVARELRRGRRSWCIRICVADSARKKVSRIPRLFP